MKKLSVNARASFEWVKVVSLVLAIIPGILSLFEALAPEYAAIASAVLAFVALVLNEIIKAYS